MMKKAQLMVKVAELKLLLPEDVVDTFQLNSEDVEGSLSALDVDAIYMLGSFFYFCMGHISPICLANVINAMSLGDETKMRIMTGILMSSVLIRNDAKFNKYMLELLKAVGIETMLLEHNESAWEMIGARDSSLIILKELDSEILRKASVLDVKALLLSTIKTKSAKLTSEAVSEIIALRGIVPEDVLSEASNLASDYLRRLDGVYDLQRQNFRSESSLKGCIEDASQSNKPTIIKLNATIKLLGLTERELAESINRCRKNKVLLMVLKLYDFTPLDVLRNGHLNSEAKAKVLDVLSDSSC